MRSRTPIIAAIVAATVAAGVVAVLLLPRPELGTDTSRSPESPSAVATPLPADPSSEAAPGVYESYSEQAVSRADGRVLLFFHASWCPQCRAIEDDIRREGVPDGITILHVDYDANQALRQQYGVTLQTTFVEVDRTGVAVQSHVAYDEPSLDAVIAAMI